MSREHDLPRETRARSEVAADVLTKGDEVSGRGRAVVVVTTMGSQTVLLEEDVNPGLQVQTASLVLLLSEGSLQKELGVAVSQSRSDSHFFLREGRQWPFLLK